MSIYLFFLPLLIPFWSYFASDHPGKRAWALSFGMGDLLSVQCPLGKQAHIPKPPFQSRCLLEPHSKVSFAFCFLFSKLETQLFYFSRVTRLTSPAQNIQVARRIDSYFITMDYCLNICLFFPSTLKIKIFLDMYLHFSTVTKTWWKGGHYVGCYTRIHLQLEDTSTLHFEQLYLKLRGLEAISRLQHIQFWPISD